MVACDNRYLSCAPKPCHKDPESGFHLARKESVLKAGTFLFQMAGAWEEGHLHVHGKPRPIRRKGQGGAFGFLGQGQGITGTVKKIETKIGDLDDFRPNSC